MKAMLLAGLMAAAAAGVNADQDRLNAAKDLYASAAYEEALSTLSRLSEGELSAPAVARQADQYRSFCLFALGRVMEAESLAEAIIRREPLTELNAADASPRLEAMFSSVRKRILPSVIRDQYRTVRTLLDDKKYAAAEPGLSEIRQLLGVAERSGAMDEGLKDLTVLVDGFLALSRANVETAASAAVATSPAVSSPPPVSSTAPAPVVPVVPAGPRVYSVVDADVRPPIATYQRAPSLPAELLTILRTQRKQMMLSLTIDEAGNVLKADVRGSVNPSYDDVLVRAAATWKYKPAMKDGVPVRYEKTVVVDIK